MSTHRKQTARTAPVAITLVALTAIAVLLHAISTERSSVILGGMRNAAHIPLFAVLTLLAFRTWANSTRPYLYAVASCLIIAATAEVSQLFTGGELDARDYLRDCLGIALAIIAIRIYRGQNTPNLPVRLFFAALSLFLTLIPAFYWITVYVARLNTFPCLTNYERFLLRPTYQPVPAATSLSASPPDSLMLSLGAAPYAGVAIIDPIADWKAFSQLTFTAHTAPGSEGPITVRVHDIDHDFSFDDRFNRTFQLTSETQTFTINLNTVANAPAGRMLDLARVSDVTFFRTSPLASDTIYLSAPCLR